MGREDVESDPRMLPKKQGHGMSSEEAVAIIEKHPRFIGIRGPVPMAELGAILEYAKSCEMEFMDIGMAQVHGLTFLITSKRWSKELRKEHDNRMRNVPQPERWLRGYDTGTSSLTIYEAMTGTKSGGGGSAPLDADDFGRCYRLLKIMPEWRTRLKEVSDKHPAWRPIVARWDELEQAYEGKQYERVGIILGAERSK